MALAWHATARPACGPHRSRHACSDDALCAWPDGLENGTEAVAALVDRLNDVHVAQAIEEIRAERAAAAAAGVAPPTVVSLSHMLPRQELLPEKR